MSPLVDLVSLFPFCGRLPYLHKGSVICWDTSKFNIFVKPMGNPYNIDGLVA